MSYPLVSVPGAAAVVLRLLRFGDFTIGDDALEPVDAPRLYATDPSADESQPPMRLSC